MVRVMLRVMPIPLVAHHHACRVALPNSIFGHERFIRYLCDRSHIALVATGTPSRLSTSVMVRVMLRVMPITLVAHHHACRVALPNTIFGHERFMRYLCDRSHVALVARATGTPSRLSSSVMVRVMLRVML